MVGFQVAPSVSLEHWHHDRKEVMRTDAAEAVAFRKVLTDFRKRLDGLIDSPGGVDLVISGDITASVRSRDPEYAAFTTQRGWGTVGGKTMLVGKRIVVILDGAWLLTVTTAGDPVVNEAQVALADGILVHEAQHVVMHQRESCIDDVKPPEMTGYAGRSLYELGLRVIDEYRAEAAAIPLRNGRREKSNFGVLASATGQSIRLAVADPAHAEDHRAFMLAVLGACQPLWVGLAYFAASIRDAAGSIGPLPPTLGKSRLWTRYVGDQWLRLARTLGGAPDARADCPSEQLEASAHGMVEVMRGQLLQVGFTFEDRQQGPYFFRERADFPV